MAEREMVYNGFDAKRQRIKWRCPLYRQLDQCPNKQECSPSAYGRAWNFNKH